MFEIALESITCVDKQSFANDSDEPYVLVFSANFLNGAAKTTLYGRYGSMDDGDVRNLFKDGKKPELCWGTSGAAVDIVNPDNVLLIAALLESDTDPEHAQGLRATTHSVLVGALASTVMNFISGSMTREALVKEMIKAFAGAIDAIVTIVPSDFEDSDDRLGKPQEVRLLPDDVTSARAGANVHKQLVFTNANSDYTYKLRFRLAQATGEASSGIGIGTQADVLDANLDPSRCAVTLDADGSSLTLIEREGSGRGQDQRIWRAFSADGGAHGPLAWAPVGEGVFSSGPAAVLSANGKSLHVFGRGLQASSGTGFAPAAKIWRAFSSDGGSNWAIAWAPVEPQGKQRMTLPPIPPGVRLTSSGRSA